MDLNLRNWRQFHSNDVRNWAARLTRWPFMTATGTQTEPLKMKFMLPVMSTVFRYVYLYWFLMRLTLRPWRWRRNIPPKRQAVSELHSVLRHNYYDEGDDDISCLSIRNSWVINFMKYIKSKGTFFLCFMKYHALKEWTLVPCILNLQSWCRWVASFTLRPL